MVTPMLRWTALFLIMSLLGLAAAEPKIAFVKVEDIRLALDSTKKHEAETQTAIDRIAKGPRRRAYESVLKELEAVSKKLKLALEDTDNPDASVRDGLKRTYSLKLQEANTLYREYKDFERGRLKEINARMVEQIEATLAEIKSTAAEVGKDHGFDWVLDSSGQSNTGVPFVLYAKNPTDLTHEVLAALGQPAAATAADTSR